METKYKPTLNNTVNEELNRALINVCGQAYIDGRVDFNSVGEIIYSTIKETKPGHDFINEDFMFEVVWGWNGNIESLNVNQLMLRIKYIIEHGKPHPDFSKKGYDLILYKGN